MYTLKIKDRITWYIFSNLKNTRVSTVLFFIIFEKPSSVSKSGGILSSKPKLFTTVVKYVLKISHISCVLVMILSFSWRIMFLSCDADLSDMNGLMVLQKDWFFGATIASLTKIGQFWMWHVVCLQHLARDCSEKSRSTSVLPINHVIQMPQCLSEFVNHDYCD